jgi:uncharacterized protein with PQ loop repeat
MMIESLAWLGALLSCLLSLPQAVQVLHSDRLDGVSATTYVLVLANAAVWGAWAMLAGQYAAGVPALVNGPAAILIIARLHRIHRATPGRTGTIPGKGHHRRPGIGANDVTVCSPTRGS